jgi:hypothetical protein
MALAARLWARRRGHHRADAPESSADGLSGPDATVNCLFAFGALSLSRATTVHDLSVRVIKLPIVDNIGALTPIVTGKINSKHSPMSENFAKLR